MHIAIDDTYGNNDPNTSKYATRNRRTHVAVVFEDAQVPHIRQQVQGSLKAFSAKLSSPPTEFHFSHIYNKRGVWQELEGMANLRILEAFSNLYRHYRWRVFLQTVDDYTLKDWPELQQASQDRWSRCSQAIRSFIAPTLFADSHRF